MSISTVMDIKILASTVNSVPFLVVGTFYSFDLLKGLADSQRPVADSLVVICTLLGILGASGLVLASHSLTAYKSRLLRLITILLYCGMFAVALAIVLAWVGTFPIHPGLAFVASWFLVAPVIVGLDAIRRIRRGIR